jgi:KDO2-lipid IV(A) lauroyltransferase
MKIVDFFLIFLIKIIQRILHMFPESICTRIGKGLGRIGFCFFGTRRRVAMANARRIDPSISPADAQAVARRCFETLGVNLIESLLFSYVPQDEYKDRFRLQKCESVDDILKSGQGMLALVFHYANWEIMGVASHFLGRPVVALARPLKGHPALNEFLNGLRTATGLTIIPNRETARDVIRFLRQGYIIAFLGDQREKRSKGVWAEFFGQKVPTSKGAVAIAMKTGIPIVPVYSVREGFLRYTLIYSDPLEIERTGAPLDELVYRNACRVNAFLERIVAAHPEEWFLVHRRFGRGT